MKVKKAPKKSQFKVDKKRVAEFSQLKVFFAGLDPP